MKSIMARSSHDSSFSFSRRHFHWIIDRVEGAVGSISNLNSAEDEQILCSSSVASDADTAAPPLPTPHHGAVARIRSALKAALSCRPTRRVRLGPRVIGTLFGPRRGHVCFAFQVNPRVSPALLVELAMPTGSLIKEMASGLVRVALECERKDGNVRLVEERQWRGYCNGRKCGYAVRRECGPGEWRVLGAVEAVTMGAGVLPPEECGGEEGDVMYMRARFERVVGSKDSEAFYMINPDGNGGGGLPELSIYLLRV